MTAPTPTRPGAAGPRARRPDESMTLLVEVMEKPLDPGYAEAAARRAARGDDVPRRRRGSGVVLLLLLGVLLGLLTVSAARELRAPEAGVSEARQVLEDQIVERRETGDDLRARSVRLSAEIEALQHTALESQDPALLETLRLDGVVNGSTPVTGPGLVVTVSDGGGGLEDAETDPSSRVRDADVQTVVNALWASGAEAIAVDGQRLTSMSAIRNAGDAILVDLVPLSGPTYVIHAVGDQDSMQTAYARTGAPAYLQLLGSRYGISSSVVPQSELELPGVGTQTLRHASPVGGSGDDSVTGTEDETEEETQEERP
ncbi:DUF881 domain-containing protein [Isoptericola cucumis]|uniref:Membrane protein n=1 Tax=Isoptericola cucumis TaxID=1776856 RepID=A0ABQ2B3U3_9MICO|nr:DUF881 domain-containing protein [Isoptericola cucumis]GGI07336.1 membrane protein [Isoptericola cucumis]